MGEAVGVPTVGGLKDSLKDFGIGALGGASLAVGYRLFGGLGMIAAPVVVGSFIKGDKGTMISCLGGIALGLMLLGGFGGGGAAEGGGSQEVM